MQLGSMESEYNLSARSQSVKRNLYIISHLYMSQVNQRCKVPLCIGLKLNPRSMSNATAERTNDACHMLVFVGL